MIGTLILYYLNVKPTHGYEIQKFLQIAGVDQWAKIQSGSIYYALSKLERTGCAEILREEKNGAKIRKIYTITKKGKQELQNNLRQELSIPITPIGSHKFFLNNILDELSRDVIIFTLQEHLNELSVKQKYWEEWKQTKMKTGSIPEAERIAFAMTLDNLKYQVLWHKEILNNLDQYIALGRETRKTIQSIDFSHVDESYTVAESWLEMQQLRDEIISDPNKVIKKIDRLIEQMKKD